MKNMRGWIERMRKKYEPIDRLASFVLRKRKKGVPVFKQYADLFVIALLLLAVAGIMAFAILSTVSDIAPIGVDNSSEPKEMSEDEPLRHPLTGLPLKKELEALPQVFGVMVENSADAWPLVGLDEAFLVIEAPVEGNIPRFLAFFSEEQTVTKIGPVRSARPYYLDWNDELDAVYTHVGGSPEALDLIKRVYETIDLNQFFQSEYFYRQTTAGRYAPHNVFTSSALLLKSLSEFSLEEPSYEAWKFADGEVKGSSSLAIDWMQGKTYDVFWEFDPESNTYLRYQAGTIMKMEDGETIQANNVVVMEADMRVTDAVGRKQLETVGEGHAYIAQNGETYLARWKKESRTDRLRFYTTDGYEIRLNAGTTWIEVVPDISQATSVNE